jgi:uncharacterized RDD family membrane protein YckC
MSGTTDNPYAAPTAAVADLAPATGEAELAGRGARFVAAMIDGALNMVALWLLGKLIGFSVFDSYASGEWLHKAKGAGLGVLCYLAINAYLLQQRGQTMGKMLMGIRIVRLAGGIPSLQHLLLRRLLPVWAVTLVPVVGVLASLVDSLMVFRANRRCLHDLIADTVVVRV